MSSHSGAAPDGAPPHGAAPNSAAGAGSPSSGTPSSGTPAGWPGGGAATGQSLAAVPEASAEADEPDEGPSFLDWAPPEDPADLDDPEGARDDVVVPIRPAADPPKPTWKLVVAPAEPADDRPRPPGIGQRRGNLAHLSANPRIRAWQRRAVIAVIVGVVFTIVVSWRLGLTLAVIAAIADTIYQSRRGLPGPRVKVTGRSAIPAGSWPSSRERATAP